MRQKNTKKERAIDSSISGRALATVHGEGCVWLEHDPEKLADFSDKIMRQNKKVERDWINLKQSRS